MLLGLIENMTKIDMIGASRGNGSEVASDASYPTPTIVPIASSDHSLSLQITTFKLKGKNYLHWSRSVQMVIRKKGKFGYLDGSIPQPSDTDPLYAAWDVQNSMVLSWLIHFMEDKIAKNYLLYPTAMAIWAAVSLAYSDLEDSCQIFYLSIRSGNLRQENGSVTGSVTTYFNALKRLW